MAKGVPYTTIHFYPNSGKEEAASEEKTQDESTEGEEKAHEEEPDLGTDEVRLHVYMQANRFLETILDVYKK